MTIPPFIYDGKPRQAALTAGQSLAWSIIQLVNLEPIEVGKTRPVLVKIRQTNHLNLSCLDNFIARRGNYSNGVFEGINFLYHLIPWVPSNRFHTRGKTYFSTSPSDTFAVDGIIQFRKVFFQSIRWGGARGLTVNVNTTTSVFWDATANIAALVQKLLDLTDSRRLTAYSFTDEAYNRLRKLKKLRFYVNYGRPSGGRPNVHVLDSIFKGTSARTKRFKVTDKETDAVREVSVEEYVYQQYNIRLQYPDLPLIESGKNFFPMEVCFLTEVPTFFR